LAKGHPDDKDLENAVAFLGLEYKEVKVGKCDVRHVT
jgi:hypothetical protein